MKTNRSEILGYCRYFRGEKENPFEGGIKATMWVVERNWFVSYLQMSESEQVSDDASFALDLYRSAGLIGFEEDDGVPLLLKAELYLLLQHWNEGVASVEDWSRFYAKWRGARL